MKDFQLNKKVIIITGGAGFLGVQHAEAIAEAGGHVCLLDIHKEGLERASKHLHKLGLNKHSIYCCDVTNKESIILTKNMILDEHDKISGLINNAAYNPAMTSSDTPASRFEDYSIQQWQKEMDLGITSAFICSQVFGQVMVDRGGGVILNIASDLSVISPDQRIYHKRSVDKIEDQPVKPVTYSVFKAGVVGLTRYLATYWAGKNVRVNALSPGGVYNNQDAELVDNLIERIPLGRMAKKGEYKGVVVFMLSQASSYITGINLLADGGRTAW